MRKTFIHIFSVQIHITHSKSTIKFHLILFNENENRSYCMWFCCLHFLLFVICSLMPFYILHMWFLHLFCQFVEPCCKTWYYVLCAWVVVGWHWKVQSFSKTKVSLMQANLIFQVSVFHQIPCPWDPVFTLCHSLCVHFESAVHWELSFVITWCLSCLVFGRRIVFVLECGIHIFSVVDEIFVVRSPA